MSYIKRIFFDASENIGIGTSRPQSKLDISGNVKISGFVSSNLIPDTNVTYDLGSSTNRWKDLYLSGSTIDLSGTKITRDTNGGIKISDNFDNALDGKFGNLLPSSNLTYDLGSPDNRWKDLYLSGTSIDLSGTILSRHTDGSLMVHDASGNYMTGRFKDVTTTGNISSIGNISTSANVGVGTDNPIYKLHVIGDTRIQGDLTVNGTQTVVNTDIQVTDQVVINNAGTGPALVVTQSGNETIADFCDDTSGNIVMRIANGGNVGIGTSNPQAKLDVSGNILVQDGTVINPSLSYSSDSNTGFYRPDNDTLGLVTGGVERLRVDANGNVGIGETNLVANLQIGATTQTNSVGDTSYFNYVKQVALLGTYNISPNAGDTIKLYIGNYNNDGAPNVYPIVCEDENGQLDLFVKARETATGLPTMYFAGNIGIGTIISTQKLHVVGNINLTGDIYKNNVVWYPSNMTMNDTRNSNTSPQDLPVSFRADFKLNTINGLNDTGTYNVVLSLKHLSGIVNQMGLTENNNLWLRSGGNTTWNTWKRVMTTDGGDFSANIRVGNTNGYTVMAMPVPTSPGYYTYMTIGGGTGGYCYWFKNDANRTVDGGARTATLRNDDGALRLMSNGGGLSIETNGVINTTDAYGNYYAPFACRNLKVDGGWIAANFGSSSGNRVVIGEYQGAAWVGAHNNALNAWAGLVVHNASLQTTSDATVKENIITADISLCYENIKKLRIVRFKYNDLVPNLVGTDKNLLGILAQELELIFPKSVSSIKGLNNLPDLKTINIDQINYSLIGALQQCQKIIEIQNIEIKELKATNEILMQRLNDLEEKINILSTR
jgi:hypothetical protein